LKGDQAFPEVNMLISPTCIDSIADPRIDVERLKGHIAEPEFGVSGIELYMSGKYEQSLTNKFDTEKK
jgi:hypothetical protein